MVIAAPFRFTVSRPVIKRERKPDEKVAVLGELLDVSEASWRIVGDSRTLSQPNGEAMQMSAYRAS